MIKYEKSFEKPDMDEEPFICDEIEYVQKITDYSRRRIAWILRITERLAELWEGTVSVSYDETTEIRDYIIIIRVKVLDFFNRAITEKFRELLSEADYLLVRACPEKFNRVEIIIVQSNAEDISLEDEEEM